MELKNQFKKVMTESVNMALATSVNNQPNVRIVTFAWDEATENKVFFCTFKGNKKTSEFLENSKVACQPLPQGPESEVQVRFFGEVKSSTTTLKELAEIIGRKYPDGDDMIENGGDMMEVYEIQFTEAFVTVCVSEAVMIKF